MERETYWKVEDMAIGDFVEVQVMNKKGDRNLDGMILRGIIKELSPSHNMVKLHTEWCCHTKDKLLKHIPKVQLVTLHRKEQLAQLDYWGSECRKHAEEHDYSCETGCPHQQRCELAYQLIQKRIQKDLVKLHDANIKWIEDMIEIVLESVSCDHSIDEDGAGKPYEDVIYNLNYEQDVIKKCIEAIPEVELKLEVDDEFMEEKARLIVQNLYMFIMDKKSHYIPSASEMKHYNIKMKVARNFLRLIIDELGQKIK